MSTDLQASKRFQKPQERRDFLGLASVWSAGVALAIGLFGALRLPVPAVFPESSSRVKLGPRQRFKDTNVIWFPEHRLWVYSEGGELYAISAVCTHLGCTVAAQREAGFIVRVMGVASHRRALQSQDRRRGRSTIWHSRSLPMGKLSSINNKRCLPKHV